MNNTKILNYNELAKTINECCTDKSGKEFVLEYSYSISVHWRKGLFCGWYLTDDEKANIHQYNSDIEKAKEALRQLPIGITFTEESYVSRDDRNDKSWKNDSAFKEEYAIFKVVVSECYSNRIYQQYLKRVDDMINRFRVVDDEINAELLNKSSTFSQKVLQNNSDKIISILNKLSSIGSIKGRISVYSKYLVYYSGKYSKTYYYEFGMNNLAEDEYTIYGFARAIAIKLHQIDDNCKMKLKLIKGSNSICCEIIAVNTCQRSNLSGWG